MLFFQLIFKVISSELLGVWLLVAGCWMLVAGKPQGLVIPDVTVVEIRPAPLAEAKILLR